MNRVLRIAEPQFELIGFAINDCVVEVDQPSTKYLRAVHRTALELAVHNCFGAEIGGFWLMGEQIRQLRKLSEYYSAEESPLVAQAIEAYLKAQLQESYAVANEGRHSGG